MPFLIHRILLECQEKEIKWFSQMKKNHSFRRFFNKLRKILKTSAQRNSTSIFGFLLIRIILDFQSYPKNGGSVPFKAVLSKYSGQQVM